MVSEANGWSPSAKAFHFYASLRGDAADILETLSEAKRHNLTWLLNFRNLEGQIARLIQRLQEYDFEIRH